MDTAAVVAELVTLREYIAAASAVLLFGLGFLGGLSS